MRKNYKLVPVQIPGNNIIKHSNLNCIIFKKLDSIKLNFNYKKKNTFIIYFQFNNYFILVKTECLTKKKQ